MDGRTGGQTPRPWLRRAKHSALVRKNKFDQQPCGQVDLRLLMPKDSQGKGHISDTEDKGSSRNKPVLPQDWNLCWSQWDSD